MATYAVRMLKPCSAVWLTLMVLTLVTFGLGGANLDGALLALLVLGIAVVKAQLVADHFMGLRRVAGFWRPLVTVYLLILGTGIALAFILAG